MRDETLTRLRSAVGTPDYFSEVTLFRRHHFTVPMNAKAHACMQFWEVGKMKSQYVLSVVFVSRCACDS